MNRLLIFLTVFIGLTACSVRTTINTPELEQEPKTAKNIIFLIGDGMGLTQTTAGFLNNDMQLNLERMPIVGLSKTHSSDQLITDSAAGATAFSIGEKTYNGAIGMNKDTVAKETILERLAADGFSTGLIATCNITHATPASFYAHQPSRNMYYEIASDMVDAPVTVFVGGGKIHFENRTDEGDGTPDTRNLISEMANDGFQFVDSFDDLRRSKGRVGYFYSDDHPASILNGRGNMLPNSINPVIELLQQETNTGFFMVVEGSQIDWGGHANESEYIITEMIDFDKAVGKALDFAAQDGNTLVVVTADHETGGYALKGKNDNYNEVEGAFSTGGHTGVMVPVYAYGPQSELFSGIYNNNDIYFKMLKALGQ